MTPLLALALVVAAPTKKDPPPKEPPTLVGEWAAESALRGGQPDLPDSGLTITFTADGKVSFKELKGDRADESSYKTDPKKNPAEIDLIPPPAEREPTMLGIYKVDGDTLTLCFTAKGERPKEFASPAGSKIVLITCKRAKKD